MPNSANDDNAIRQVWQTQEVERVTITIDELRGRAARFERRIRRRNIREYVAGTVVIAVFALQVFRQPTLRAIPPLLMIAGTLYALIQLHRRSRSRPIPEHAAFATTLTWHRAELERQRDALRTVWSWYLLPFVPGLIATLVMSAIEHGIHALWYGAFVFFAALLIGVWKLNQSAARRLETCMEDLRSLDEGRN